MDSSNLSHSYKVNSSSVHDISGSSGTNVHNNLQLSENRRYSSDSSDVSNVRVYGANSNANADENQTLTKHDNVRSTATNTKNDLPDHDINETFTLNNKVIDGVFPLQNVNESCCTPVCNDRTNITQSGTATKERPRVEVPEVNTNTVNKTIVNSDTVTKSRVPPTDIPIVDVTKVIEATCLKECSTRPNDGKTSVVRAFNFDRMPCPSPAGKCLSLKIFVVNIWNCH